MKILAIGDIVATVGVNFIRDNLPAIKAELGIDLCIANGENSAIGNGITRKIADGLIQSGIDILTMGNHTFDKGEVVTLMNEGMPIIRPANYPSGTAGNGCYLFNIKGMSVAVVNLLGRVFLNPVECPFRTVDYLLECLKGDNVDVIIVDFHAEATSEKQAMGHYLDGRATCLFGTHTHVQTADECILPKGMAYISDLGMTGPGNSVLGVKSNLVINRFITCIPCRLEPSDNPAIFNSIILEVDDSTKKAVSITRHNLKE